MDTFSIFGFVWRIAFALALVLLTFNPMGYNYVDWVRGNFPSFTPEQTVAGIVLFALWIFLWRSMIQSIGVFGFLLLGGLAAACVWLLASWGWLTVEGTTTIAWIALVALGFILGIGMSWATLRRELTGQASVDQVDDRR